MVVAASALVWRKRRVGNYALTESGFPLPIEFVVIHLRRPVLAPIAVHDFMPRPRGFFEQGREHFVGRMPVVQRRNQRLDDRCRSIEGSTIAPRFQKMGCRNVPITQSCGFVGI